MADIVCESETSKGSFYHYFDGKDALLSSLSVLFDERYEELMQQERFGTVFRVKGFLQKKDGKWLSFNATHDQMHVQTMEQGQDVLIVIGEHLAKEEIEQLFK